jgi:hypothetical protein
MSEQKELSPGQKAIDITFNVGGRADVNEMKQVFANAWDTVHKLAEESVSKIPDLPVVEGTLRKSNIRRWEAITKTSIEKTAMEAVRCITR